MSPPLDDGIEKLQAFNSLLDTTSATLDSGAADLLRLAQALSAGEQRLATDLNGLDGALDAVLGEAESTAAAAVAACHELGAAAEEVTAELLQVEQEAEASADKWAQALDQKGNLLEPAFNALQDEGWAPLSHVLESERRSFEQWASEAGTALSALVQELGNVQSELARDAGECTTAGTAFAGAPCFDEFFWSQVSNKALLLRSDTVPTLRTQQREVAQALDQEYDQLAKAAQSDAPEVRIVVALKAESLAVAIGHEGQEVTRVAEDTVNALDRVRMEVESNAIQGEDAGPRATEIVSLAPKIEKADEDLETIRAAMEATGS